MVLKNSNVEAEEDNSSNEEIELDNILQQRRRSSHLINMRQHSMRRPSFFVEEGNHIIPLTIIGSNNEEILPEDIAVAPDGGWGWVVVFASFMISTIMGGTTFGFGIMLDAIIENSKIRLSAIDYSPEIHGDEITVSTVAAIGGSAVAFTLFSGPFSASLTNKIGFRLTAVIGSCLSSFGFAASWYFCRNGIPNVPALFIFFGLFGGVGFSFMLIPCIITVGFYFEKKRALATGIAVCGNGVGTTILPPILSILILKYEWYGTLLIQSGIILCCAFFAILYRPLDLTKNSLGNHVDEINLEDNENSTENDLVKDSEIIEEQNNITRETVFPVPEPRPIITTGVQTRPKLQRSVRISEATADLMEIAEDEENDDNENESTFEIEIRQPSVKNKFVRLQSLGYIGNTGLRKNSMGNIRNRRISLALPSPDLMSFDPQSTRVLRVHDKNTLNKPMNRDNIFYHGSIDHIKESPQDINNVSLIFSTSGLEENEPSILEDKDTGGTKQIEQNWKINLKKTFYIVKKMLDFGLLKSPTFIVICVMSGISLIGFFVPFLYLKGLAQEKGIDGEKSTFLISIIGISDTIGRIIIGITANSVGNHVLFINNAALTIGGLATFVVPFLDTYPFLVIYTCIFGLVNASVASLRSIIIVELLGLSNLTNAFGLTLFCEGIASFIGSPLAGFLRDSTGTYDVSFYVAGGFLVLSGVICYPIYFVKDWEDRKKNVKNQLG